MSNIIRYNVEDRQKDSKNLLEYCRLVTDGKFCKYYEHSLSPLPGFQFVKNLRAILAPRTARQSAPRRSQTLAS